VVEGSVVTDDGQHPTHPGRQFGVFHIQFDIGGKLAVLAVGTEEVGTQEIGGTDRAVRMVLARKPR
jgi:hypothetical protein